jgi:hypothetical protein
MESIVDPLTEDVIDYDMERQVFVATFRVLANSLGDKSFAFANRDRSKLTAGFSIYHFEAITLALQPILDKLDPASDSQMSELSTALTEVKLDVDFVEATTGGGKNSPGPLADRVRRVSERLANAFG